MPPPDAVAEPISEQVLRWFPSGGSGLVFVTREHKPLVRTCNSPHIWK